MPDEAPVMTATGPVFWSGVVLTSRSLVSVLLDRLPGGVALARAVGRRGLFLHGGGPAGQQLQVLLRRRARFGGVSRQGDAGVGRDLHGVKGEVEPADGRVAEVLDAAAVQ